MRIFERIREDRKIWRRLDDREKLYNKALAWLITYEQYTIALRWLELKEQKEDLEAKRLTAWKVATQALVWLFKFSVNAMLYPTWIKPFKWKKDWIHK